MDKRFSDVIKDMYGVYRQKPNPLAKVMNYLMIMTLIVGGGWCVHKAYFKKVVINNGTAYAVVTKNDSIVEIFVGGDNETTTKVYNYRKYKICVYPLVSNIIVSSDEYEFIMRYTISMEQFRLESAYNKFGLHIKDSIYNDIIKAIDTTLSYCDEQKIYDIAQINHLIYKVVPNHLKKYNQHSIYRGMKFKLSQKEIEKLGKKIRDHNIQKIEHVKKIMEERNEKRLKELESSKKIKRSKLKLLKKEAQKQIIEAEKRIEEEKQRYINWEKKIKHGN